MQGIGAKRPAVGALSVNMSHALCFGVKHLVKRFAPAQKVRKRRRSVGVFVGGEKSSPAGPVRTRWRAARSLKQGWGGRGMESSHAKNKWGGGTGIGGLQPLCSPLSCLGTGKKGAKKVCSFSLGGRQHNTTQHAPFAEAALQNAEAAATHGNAVTT